MADRPVFYIDRCLVKVAGRALQAIGAQVEFHDQHFAQDALDEDWIPDVAARGWVILTKDKNIRRRASEREALLLAEARIFTLSGGNMTGTEMGATLVARLADMEALVASQPPPFVAVVGRDGVQVVLPRAAP